MIKRIKKWVSSLSVKVKLIVYGYAIITPVLIVICAGILIHNYNMATQKRFEYNIADVKSLSDSIDLLQSDIKAYTTYICINQQIHNLLVANDVDRYNLNARLWQEKTPMEFVQDMIDLRGEIKTIAIYPENGIRPYLRGMDGSVYLSTIDDVRDTDIYKETLDSATGIIWRRVETGKVDTYLTNRTQKVVLYREIFDLTQKRRLGFIAIGLNGDNFYSLCENIVRNNEAAVVLDPNSGKLACAGEIDPEIENYLLQEEFLHQNYRERDNYFNYGNYDIACRQLHMNGTIVCKIVPKQTLGTQISGIIYMPLLLLLGLLIGLFPLLMIISNLVTKPLREVSNAIRSFSTGDFEQQVEVTTDDEIGEVARCFNKMVGDIKKLIDENYVITLSEKESELAALQAQINPHFLYNTLDLLYWQAMGAGNEEIAESILDLSQLFRLALNQGKNEVSVEQEMELITHYLQIQKLRFPRKLNYEINIEENVRLAKIPKLILQPFVENAIVHGFENVSTPCLLTVDVRLVDNKVHFEIKDTGAGMGKEQLASLWESEPVNYSKQRIGRYAIKNIKERLQLKYHEDFVLDIQSDIGKGTTVIMEIPYEEGF